MKNKLFILVAIGFVAGTMLTGCNRPDKKAETSQKIIQDAQQNVAEANLALQVAIEQFKKESEEKIAANEKTSLQSKQKINPCPRRNWLNWNKKNKELKEKLADFKAEGNEQWEAFRVEFSHDMDEMGKVFNDSIVNN